MATAGACHAKKSAQVFAVRRWKSNEDWMARTGYASAAAISGCAIAQHPGDRPQVLPAYGLQDLRNEHQDPKTKSNPNPNTMCLLITPGGNRGTGHFYLAKNRTFLLCVDTNLALTYRLSLLPNTVYHKRRDRKRRGLQRPSMQYWLYRFDCRNHESPPFDLTDESSSSVPTFHVPHSVGSWTPSDCRLVGIDHLRQ